VSKLLAAFGPITTGLRDELPEPLTRREKEILRLMGRGLTNPEIAEELVISPHTVRTHATHIYDKLAVSNRARAVRKARQLGIIT
jgi:ATP/maltotriose-dependent transcriptional regulator MalT